LIGREEKTTMNRNSIAKFDRLVSFARRGLVLVGFAALLAACQTKPEPGPLWTDYRLRHPIALVEKDRTLDVFVASGRAGLSPDQRAEVLAFAQSWRNEGSGRFVIEQPSNARNAGAAGAAVREIRSILTASGVSPQAISVRSYRLPHRDMLAVVTVNYSHLAAHVSGCGQWPDYLGVTDDRKHFENIHYWNFGCATQKNLAAMVANPADLVQPRAETPIYAARRATVLDKYRKGESTATTYPDATKGAISDLGK
jgi:pilus assembly protein CpaD